MTQVDTLKAKFVDEIPDNLYPGVFYVSIEHTTMMHLCACGCGNEIVLPLAPQDWRFQYDGEEITVRPSIGNWSFPCRSHYFVERGRIDWAGNWTDEQIKANRHSDRQRKARIFCDQANEGGQSQLSQNYNQPRPMHKNDQPVGRWTKFLRCLGL